MHIYSYDSTPQSKGLDTSTVAIAKRFQESHAIV